MIPSAPPTDSTAARELAELKMMFDNILEGTLAGYWDWYIQEDREYLSPTFKSMFGYEDHELPNTPDAWQKIIHPDDLPLVFENFDKHVATRGEHPYNNEVRYHHKDGHIVWVHCRGRVIEWDKDGKAIRMVGCHVDITKAKEAEQSRIKIAKLEARNAELQEFAYVASHDLQEPLRTIRSFIQVLREDFSANVADPEVGTIVKYIDASASRMQMLIRDILSYSRLGTDSREPGPVETSNLISHITKDLQQLLEENEAWIVAHDMPVVHGKSTELRLLFQNLISNAVKFSRPGVSPRIEISAERRGDRYYFSVSDNGIGIEEKYYKRVFSIFQRLHTYEEYEGTGIGLAQCEKIVALHGGEIAVTSTVGKGSTFTFSLPAHG